MRGPLFHDPSCRITFPDSLHLGMPLYVSLYIFIFPSLSFGEMPYRDALQSLEADTTFFVCNNPEFTANGLIQKTKSYITDTAGSRTNTHALQYRNGIIREETPDTWRGYLVQAGFFSFLCSLSLDSPRKASIGVPPSLLFLSSFFFFANFCFSLCLFFLSFITFLFPHCRNPQSTLGPVPAASRGRGGGMG